MASKHYLIQELKRRNSVQDNIEKLDSSYIEYCIFSLFKIDVINLIKMKASLAKNFHIQPSEIDGMPMWEYELFISELNNQVKEENDQQQREMDKYNIPDPKKMSNPSNAMKQYSGNIPKMPSIPKF